MESHIIKDENKSDNVNTYLSLEEDNSFVEKPILINNKDDKIKYVARIFTPNRRCAEIIANSINVDEEFSKSVFRELTCEDNILIISYSFDAYLIKSFKKSVKALYENIELIIDTIKLFDKQNS